MIVLHRKTLEGAEIGSLPDLSMQSVRRASHNRLEKFDFGTTYLVLFELLHWNSKGFI